MGGFPGSSDYLTQLLSSTAGTVVVVAIAVIIVVVGILGFFLPLIVNGIYNKASKILKEVEKATVILEEIRATQSGIPIEKKEEYIGGILVDESLYGGKKKKE